MRVEDDRIKHLGPIFTLKCGGTTYDEPPGTRLPVGSVCELVPGGPGKGQYLLCSELAHPVGGLVRFFLVNLSDGRRLGMWEDSVVDFVPVDAYLTLR